MLGARFDPAFRLLRREEGDGPDLPMTLLTNGLLHEGLVHHVTPFCPLYPIQIRSQDDHQNCQCHYQKTRELTCISDPFRIYS